MREIKAVSGLSPLAALSFGIEKSIACRVGCVHDKPFAIFGVGDSPIEGEGALWMVGTDDIRKFGKTVTRLAKAQIAEFNRIWPVLRNYADERNTVHIEWLRLLGAQFLKKTPYGVEGLMFREFKFDACG